MSRIVFQNANLLDGEQPGPARASYVVVEGERITERGHSARRRPMWHRTIV